MKKLRAVALAFVLGITPIFGVTVDKVAAAGATQHIWTGAAGDGKMSTAGNWNTNEVPDSDDSVSFPAGTGSQVTITADLNAELSKYYVGHINGGASGGFVYYFAGAVRTKTFQVGSTNQPNETGYVGITGTLILYPEASLFQALASATNSVLEINGALNLQTQSQLNIRGPGRIIIESSSISGTVSELNLLDEADLIFNNNTTFSPAYLDSTNGKLYAVNTSILGSTLSTFNDGSVLYLRSNTNLDKKLTLNNGSTITVDSYTIEDNPDDGPIVLSGDITFGSGAATYDSGGFPIDLKLTGNLTGEGKIVPKPGNIGNVIVELASGKTNNSGMQSGETTPEKKVTVITDSNTNPLEVWKNNVVVVNGERGNTTVKSGGVLKGSGKVGTLFVEAGGMVAPGESPGCLTASNTTLSPGSIFEVEIAGKSACVEYDQLKVNGTVSLEGATLDTRLINGFKPQTNDTFVVLDNDGNDAITGTFKDLAEGATFTVDGYVFKVTYTGGDGNDVAITVQNVPNSPNTGVQLLAANPLLTLALTTASAGVLFMIARRYSLINKK